MTKFLTKLKNLYINFRGYHTKRHFLVMESDDWGSIRMPSLETFRRLQIIGDHPENNAFLRNDSLETESDLIKLYDVLTSVKDSNGKPAKITANYAMANPNFERINYIEGVYHYEPFFRTYDKYYHKNKVLEYVKKGIALDCFYPQLHCREHLNVQRWMHDLKNNKEDTIIAFKNQMIGIEQSFSKGNIFGYMDAFNPDIAPEKELADIFVDAMRIFEKTFGYRSKTFVASCFVWGQELEKTMATEGVIGIQTSIWQNVPQTGIYKLRRKLHYTGEHNSLNQIYSVRNCAYEPAYRQNPMEAAEECLKSIRLAFKNNKPAIINTHRFNYIGSINKNNSIENLNGLYYLLSTILKEYNDIEFISTDELIEIMRNE